MFWMFGPPGETCISELAVLDLFFSCALVGVFHIHLLSPKGVGSGVWFLRLFFFLAFSKAPLQLHSVQHIDSEFNFVEHVREILVRRRTVLLEMKVLVFCLELVCNAAWLILLFWQPFRF